MIRLNRSCRPWLTVLACGLLLVCLVSCPPSDPPQPPGYYILVLPKGPTPADVADPRRHAIEVFCRSAPHPGDRIHAWQFNGRTLTELDYFVCREVDNEESLRSRLMRHCLAPHGKSAKVLGSEEEPTLWSLLDLLVAPLAEEVKYEDFHLLFGFPPPLLPVLGEKQQHAPALPAPAMRDFIKACGNKELIRQPLHRGEREVLRSMHASVQRLSKSVLKRCKLAFLYEKSDPAFKELLQFASQEAAHGNQQLCDLAEDVLDDAMRETWLASLEPLGCAVSCFGAAPEKVRLWEAEADALEQNEKSPWEGKPRTSEHRLTGFPAALFTEREAPSPVVETTRPPDPSPPAPSPALENRTLIVSWKPSAGLELAAWVENKRVDFYMDKIDLDGEASAELVVDVTGKNSARIVLSQFPGDKAARFFIRRYGAVSHSYTPYGWKLQKIPVSDPARVVESTGTATLETLPPSTSRSHGESYNLPPHPSFGWREITLN